ncbi:MAG: hypothetical protein AAB263_19275, partial [Planctomycetota bacterium]
RAFEIYTTGDNTLKGRLTARKDRNNNATTIAYVYAVGSQSGYDRGKLEQISTVTDPYGQQLSFTYVPVPVWIHWKVQSVTLPNGTTISYTYTAAHYLSTVTYPDSTVSTFTYGNDSVSQKDYVVYDDSGATDTHRRKTAYYSSLTYTLPDTTVISQTPGQVHKVTTPNGETTYMHWDLATAGQDLFYLGGNTLMWTTRATGQLRTNVSLATNYVHDESALLPNLTGLQWKLKVQQQYTGYKNLHVGALDAFNRQTTEVNNAVGYHQTSKTYPDGTSVAATWNSLNERLTFTDRLGRITTNTYDSNGNHLTEKDATGITGERTRSWTYNSRGQPLTATDFNGNVTDYTYDSAGHLTHIIEPADVTSGTRADTVFAYDSVGRLSSSSDPNGRQTTYSYDSRNRIVTLTYADTSTETFTYGTGSNANLVVAQTDRNTNQTTYSYDTFGRRTTTVQAASTAVAVTETCTFLHGTTKELTCLRAGELTTYAFDYENRIIATQSQANGSTTLTSTVEFDVLGRRLSTSDAYGRRSFFVYDVNDRLVRQVHELIPGTLGTLASPDTAPGGGFAGTGSAGTAYLTSARDEAVMAFTRILTANPAYVIEETTTDAIGRTLTRKDGRNIQTAFTYDNLDRMLTQVEDAGGLAATTTMVYDAQSNRTSVTSPRSVVTAMTYTNRNLPKQITEASGTGEATVVSTTTYTLTKKPATTTDALSRVTNYVYGVCCDRLITITDPAGFTTNFTYDYVGNRLTVTDGNALTTVTTFDARNRTATVTNAASETTSIVYDDSLNDGVGLDATGSPLLAFLSGLGIASGSDFSAVKVTNPAGNITYTVTDGVGRTVRSVDPLLHATTMAYDTVLASGVGAGLVETIQTDALSHVTRSRTDGAGRVRQGVDALGFVSTATFDAAGNQLSQLDPNAIGWNASYDGRNRVTSRSSTRTDVAEGTSWTYDADNNRLTETDGL